MEIQDKFGQAVKKARQQKGLSQEELAHQIDADQAYVSRIEAGQMNATLETIGQIAKVLDVEAFELLKG